MSKTTALRRGAVIAAAAALVLSGSAISAPPAEASVPSACANGSSTTQTLRYGDRGWRVTYLQCVLRSMGYPTVAIDGVFGTNTRRAVVDFQRYIAGVTADGIVGPVTWRALLRNSPTY